MAGTRINVQTAVQSAGNGPKRKPGYLPGLDGLRAVAILGVLLAHDLPWTFMGHSDAAWHGYGGWGVQLFFAISGTLICWRLLEDEAKSGDIQLRAFYIRRLFRIQPAALLYLAVIAILFATAAVPSDWLYWWSAVLSFTNFLITASTPPGAPAFVGHFWTLAVEEHFYILISVLFLVARRRRVVVLACVLVLLLTGQTLAQRWGHFSPVHSPRRTYWTIQFLLVPSFLTLLIRRPEVRSYVTRYGKPWVATLIVFLMMWIRLFFVGFHVVLATARHFHLFPFVTGGGVAIFYGFGLWVISIMLHPSSWSTRVLEWAPLRFIGRISYSLYLWHVLFFMAVFLADQIHSHTVLFLTERPWRYIATLVMTLFSYYFVEKPLIRVGHRIAPPATVAAPGQELADTGQEKRVAFRR